MESYVERPPLPGLAGVVRTAWIQRTGETAYLPPRQLLGGDIERCACGHEHSASYKPFLATRSRAPLRV
jgi:hypothetical protein